ncbi:MAG: metal-dependent hydrolase [Calditrichia bacterium]
MDTITQIALGAAVGEVVLGRKVGNKALLWGAIGGTIPDLDVLATPFASDVNMLVIHRGFTHSVFFSLLFAPLFGWLIAKLYRKKPEASWREWGWLMYWALLTHPLLDMFTIYGTQFLNPFSDELFGTGAIFIIDPLYTLPLLAGLILILRLQRNNPQRFKIVATLLAISTSYLLLASTLRIKAQSNFETALQQQNIPYSQIMTTASPLNTIMWMGAAANEDSVWIGNYSFLDSDKDITFHRVPKNTDLIAKNLNDLPVKRLLWFSHGFYTVRKENDELILSDLRFGRSDAWTSTEGQYVFQFFLDRAEDGSNEIVDFHRPEPSFNNIGESFSKLYRRVKGDKSFVEYTGLKQEQIPDAAK